MPRKHAYDAIIIGTGQAGKPLAMALAQAGWQTAIVERENVGGTCVNVGCTPTKTMAASARIAHLARRAADYGVDVGPVHVDMKRVLARKRRVVESFRAGGERGLEATSNLTLIRGNARFTGSHSLEVDGPAGDVITLEAGKIFINTGARPVQLAGVDPGVRVLDNATIMELDEAPEHLLIVGGGYVGIEFGQMFRRFGSRVTIVQRGPQLLAREDADVAGQVLAILREDGIDVLLDSRESGAKRNADGGIDLEVTTADRRQTLRGSHLLAATGRTPNSADLNLDAAGLGVDEKGFIPVNSRLETGVPGIYALGDVKGGPAFTHIAYDDYRVVKQNLLDGGGAAIDGRMVPYTVFIDPQLGRAGLTETEARKRHDVLVAKLPMDRVARAIETDETRGFMKAVVDRSTGRILGCAILGIEGGEVTAVIQAAMMGDLPYTRLRDGVFAHPTLAESLNNLFGAISDK